MRQLSQVSDNEQGSLGPGTDLIISLLAVMILVLAVLQTEFKVNLDELRFYKKNHTELVSIKVHIDSLKAIIAKQHIALKLQRENIDERDKELEQFQAIEQKYKVEQLLFERIKKQQSSIIEEIGRQFSDNPTNPIGRQNSYQVSIGSSGNINIYNDVTSQWISFGSSILFDQESSTIKKEGRNVILKVGKAFKQELNNIQEIQILGHADITGDEDFNLNLASARSTSVLQFLQKQVGINPAEHIVSATSYGEYMPVNRSYSDTEYSRKKLIEDNATPLDRARNRRIEIVLKFNTMSK